LELITQDHPGAGNIITFGQFLFISLEGFFFATNCCTKRRMVPLKDYMYLVITFFLVSVSNNYALKFNISMPLHMIFKSGSLIANMALGIIILKNRYRPSKYVAVGLISIGIAICTIASAQGLDGMNNSMSKGAESSNVFLSWLFGILLLTFALLASSRMGIFQETLAKVYGKHPRESMFYCHALPLPGFIFLYRDIWEHAVAFSSSEPFDVFGLITLPKHWVYLIANALTQYICARSVFTLTTETSSLVVTFVVTLRKFLSLLISIYYFSNPFTTNHWIGTVLVFLGTFIFVEVINVDRVFDVILGKNSATQVKTTLEVDNNHQKKD
jgi:UDP-xylose/UDP-N-acetylglucosamine transporter B4